MVSYKGKGFACVSSARKMGIMKKKTKLLLLRVLLGILILANMTAIFLFSAQSGEESGKTSGKVAETVAEVTVKDFSSKPPAEQEQIVEKIHPPLRKIAHMAEFGSLGALIFLFLLTYSGAILPRFFIALAATLLYACTDELHQMLSDSRGPQFRDVLIDLSGALITCTVLLILFAWIKHRKGVLHKPMQTTRYTVPASKLNRDLRLAVASDLHGCPHETVVKALSAEKPDLILIPGDLMDDRDLRDATHSGYEFLRQCAAIAPTYYSLGNHELACYHKGNPWRHPIPIPLTDEIRTRIAATGAVLLDNDCVTVDGLCICGLTSGINGKVNRPNLEAIKRFDTQSGYRILLCHHPEYFMPFLKDTGIELTVSGHAHGGHWRFFGHGTYAPGQGIFPKYTAGVYDGRWIISRGLGNHTRIPRIGNPTELVIIDMNRKGE